MNTAPRPDQRSHPAFCVAERCQHGPVPATTLFSFPPATLCPVICEALGVSPDGNLIPKRDTFQMTKPERPKHSSPVGCVPSIHPSRDRTCPALSSAGISIHLPQSSIRFHRTQSVNDGDG